MDLLPASLNTVIYTLCIRRTFRLLTRLVLRLKTILIDMDRRGSLAMPGAASVGAEKKLDLSDSLCFTFIVLLCVTFLFYFTCINHFFV